MNDGGRPAARVAIWVAVIGALGVVIAALITVLGGSDGSGTNIQQNNSTGGNNVVCQDSTCAP